MIANFRFSRPAAAVLAALLAGCASVGPDYAEPVLEVPAAWSRADGATDTARRGDLARWWEQLGDPLLTELIAEALAAAPDLQAAQARLRQARARRDLAGAERFPTVSVSATASRSRSSAETGTGKTTTLYDAGFDAAWEPDVFGGTRRALEAAEADYAASGADLAATRVSLAAEVALNYVELRGFQRRLAIARENLASQSETLQLTDWRAQAGLSSTLDVEQSRANREQTRAQIPALETSLAQAGHRIAILLGRAPGALRERLAAAGNVPALPERIAVGIPADTLRQRPDLRAAERRLAAETARVGVATAQLYPSFSLGGALGLQALTLDGMGSGDAVTRSLLAGIAAPLFDAGRIRRNIEIQDAVQEQALVSYQSTLLLALEEVENALVALARSRERQAALTSAEEAARNAALLARHRYTTGLADFQAVLDTERSVLTIQDSLAASQAEGASALIQLYKALGGGWEGIS